MKKKSILRNIILLCFILVIIFVISYLNYYNNSHIRSEYRTNVFLLLIVPMMLKILLGISINGDQIYIEYNKEGKWNINLSKILILGVPSMIIAFIPILVLYDVVSIHLSENVVSIIWIFQILFGHIIATSFSKIKV